MAVGRLGLETIDRNGSLVVYPFRGTTTVTGHGRPGPGAAGFTSEFEALSDGLAMVPARRPAGGGER